MPILSIDQVDVRRMANDMKISESEISNACALSGDKDDAEARGHFVGLNYWDDMEVYDRLKKHGLTGVQNAAILRYFGSRHFPSQEEAARRRAFRAR